MNAEFGTVVRLDPWALRASFVKCMCGVFVEIADAPAQRAGDVAGVIAAIDAFPCHNRTSSR